MRGGGGGGGRKQLQQPLIWVMDMCKLMKNYKVGQIYLKFEKKEECCISKLEEKNSYKMSFSINSGNIDYQGMLTRIV